MEDALRAAMKQWIIPPDAWKRCRDVCYVGLAAQGAKSASMDPMAGGLRYFDVTDFTCAWEIREI
jgi:hypothetical protein